MPPKSRDDGGGVGVNQFDVALLATNSN